MPTDPTDEPRGPAWRDEILERLGIADLTWSRLPLSDGTDPQRRTSHQSDAGSLVFFSSGSLGQPKMIRFSESDWQDGLAHRAECLAALGVRAGQTAGVALPFGPWFSGDQVCDALMSLGCRVLPIGHYSPHLPSALELLRRCAANLLITTPSLAHALATEVLPLEHLILLGEHCPTRLRARLRDAFDCEPLSLYAASEAIIGPQVADQPDCYQWNPDRLHLEVLRSDGQVTEQGTGELIVTRRFGEALPLLRYRLGDRVELAPGQVRLLGRIGHGFSLATGVKLSRLQIEQILDRLPLPITEAHFRIAHDAKQDRLTIQLTTPEGSGNADELREQFAATSLDLADAIATGHAEIQIRLIAGPDRAKRRVTFTETPWSL